MTPTADEATPDALAEAIVRLDATSFLPLVTRASAKRFAARVYRRVVVELLQRLRGDPSLYKSATD